MRFDTRSWESEAVNWSIYWRRSLVHVIDVF